jgi:hypothetical protein
MMGKLGAFAKAAGPLGSGAMAKLAGASAPPTPAQQAKQRAAGFSQAASSLADALPGTAFGRMGRRASRLGFMSKALGKAAAGAKAAGAGRLAAGLGGASALAGRGAALAGGPVGIAVAAVITAGEAAIGFGKAIHGAAEETLRAQERLARASGAMASVFAEREVIEILRDQRQGGKLAGTARDLSRGEQSLKDTVEPIETLITNIKNTVLASMERILSDILTPVSFIAEIAGKQLFGDPKEDPLTEALKRIADETERRRAAGDAAFARPEVARHRP